MALQLNYSNIERGCVTLGWQVSCDMLHVPFSGMYQVREVCG